MTDLTREQIEHIDTLFRKYYQMKLRDVLDDINSYCSTQKKGMILMYLAKKLDIEPKIESKINWVILKSD